MKRYLAPVLERRGAERLAFAFLLLCAAGTSANAVANVALAACLLFTIVWRVQARRRGEPLLAPFRRRSPVGLPVAVFVALSALSCFFSTSPARSIPELKGLVTFALVPLTLALVREARDADLLVDLWRVAALVMVADGLWQYVRGADSTNLRVTGWQSIYMTYAGLLTALALLLAGRAISANRPRLARVLDLATAGLGAAVVALTFTRSAVLGLFAGILALLVAFRPRLLPLLPVAAAVFYLALPANVRERVRSSFDPNDETARDRVAMWTAGLHMIRDHPLTGVGPGRVKDLYPAYEVQGAINKDPGHLHDNLVTVAAETGLASAAAYLWLMGAFALSAARAARRGPGAPFARGALAVVVGLFFAGLFEYNFGDVEILRATLVLMALPFAVLPREGASKAP